MFNSYMLNYQRVDIQIIQIHGEAQWIATNHSWQSKSPTVMSIVDGWKPFVVVKLFV